MQRLSHREEVPAWVLPALRLWNYQCGLPANSVLQEIIPAVDILSTEPQVITCQALTQFCSQVAWLLITVLMVAFAFRPASPAYV